MQIVQQCRKIGFNKLWREIGKKAEWHGLAWGRHGPGIQHSPYGKIHNPCFRQLTRLLERENGAVGGCCEETILDQISAMDIEQALEVNHVTAAHTLM